MKAGAIKKLEEACLAATEEGVKFGLLGDDALGLTPFELQKVGVIALAIMELKLINQGCLP